MYPTREKTAVILAPGQIAADKIASFGPSSAIINYCCSNCISGFSRYTNTPPVPKLCLHLLFGFVLGITDDS